MSETTNFIDQVTKHVDTRSLIKDIPGGKEFLVNYVHSTLQNKYSLTADGDKVTLSDKQDPTKEALDNGEKVSFQSAIDKLLIGFVNEADEYTKLEKAQKEAYQKRKDEEAKKHTDQHSLRYQLASKAAEKNKKLLDSL